MTKRNKRIKGEGERNLRSDNKKYYQLAPPPGSEKIIERNL